MIFQLDLLNFGSLFTFAKKFLECPDFHTRNGTSRQYQILENFRSKFFFFRHFGHCGTNKHTLRNPQGFFRIFLSQFLMFECFFLYFESTTPRLQLFSGRQQHKARSSLSPAERLSTVRGAAIV